MKKIRFYKALIFEIIETLASICLYLETEGRRSHNPNYYFMHDHFEQLKTYSKALREKSK